MEYTEVCNAELLERVIGTRGAKQLYKGTLHPLFAPKGSITRCHERLAAARRTAGHHKQVYQKKRVRKATLYQAPRLFELLAAGAE